MIKFRCQNCNMKIGVQSDYAGRKVWCPKCTKAITVPRGGVREEGSNNGNDMTQYSVFVCHGLAEEQDQSIRASEEMPITEPAELPTVVEQEETTVFYESPRFLLWSSLIALVGGSVIIFLLVII